MHWSVLTVTENKPSARNNINRMQDMKSFENTRQYYRIRYPFFYRPKIKIEEEDIDNDVIELSERGVRFLYEGTRPLSMGSELNVTIIFYDGAAFEFSGDLLRVEGKDVILRFSGSLPLSRIMQEQRYLMSRSVSRL
jgi:hypothetical protein